MDTDARVFPLGRTGQHEQLCKRFDVYITILDQHHLQTVPGLQDIRIKSKRVSGFLYRHAAPPGQRSEAGYLLTLADPARRIA